MTQCAGGAAPAAQAADGPGKRGQGFDAAAGGGITVDGQSALLPRPPPLFFDLFDSDVQKS